MAVEDKRPFLIELDRHKYGCSVSEPDGRPRGCRVVVIQKPFRQNHYAYRYVRVYPGEKRKHGPHEDACDMACIENASWKDKDIAKYTIILDMDQYAQEQQG